MLLCSRTWLSAVGEGGRQPQEMASNGGWGERPRVLTVHGRHDNDERPRRRVSIHIRPSRDDLGYHRAVDGKFVVIRTRSACNMFYVTMSEQGKKLKVNTKAK